MKTVKIEINLYQKGDKVILPLDMQNSFRCSEGVIYEDEWLFSKYDELSKNPDFDIFSIRRNVLVEIATEESLQSGPVVVSSWSLKPKKVPSTYTLK